jgi:HlyD family secretion protein
MRRRSIVALLLLAALAAAGLTLWRRNGRDAVDVTIQAATRQPVFRSTVTASGEIVATRYADIGSSLMGRIVSLPVVEGQRVRAGQVLARIDPVQARADLSAAQALVEAQEAEREAAERQVKAAEADVALADARLREAGLNLSRVRELHESGLTPRAELDTAQAADDSTRAQLAAARAALERARNSAVAARQRASQARAQTTGAIDLVSKTEITAPMDGVVSRLQVREGEMVVIGIQNQPGTTLMTISDLSSINAEVKVAEADVLRLALEQTATIELEAIPGRIFSGKVVEIGTSALPVVGTAAAAREFRVVVRLDRADAALRPGLTCDAEILVSERANVLTVPLQSVVLRAAAPAAAPTAASGPVSGAEQTGGFLAREGSVWFTPVATGIIGGLLIEVDGLEDGAPVVSGPFQALRDLQDGARIRVRQESGR